MPPLALTDDQLSAVLAAAEPLPPADCNSFLQRVAAPLNGHAVVGDGLVSRYARQAQRELLRPPTLEDGERSKYR